MGITWEEVQIACLQKMFSINGDTLVKDSNTLPYIRSMPAAANEALLILATAGRQFKKCLTIQMQQEEETGKEEGEESASAEESADTETEGEQEAKPMMTLGGWQIYNLAELTGDFYALDEIRLDNGESYEAFKQYRMEGNALLLLPVSEKGTFRIWYEAYPPKLTKDTPPEFVIDLHPEEVSMVTL